ncbi:probable phytol kinase 1, chloroplastic isoform X1 [Lycium barbarum]|uniref:probable phytol kinase 1, chloroplastic isoform X1 n=1 Tax=Lycium barbarum TaxID=112863 RepID=UPI00293E36E6|nr:probable phytol kinase 1, chloroplastic isoform X1 [Lycium barbarum]
MKRALDCGMRACGTMSSRVVTTTAPVVRVTHSPYSRQLRLSILPSTTHPHPFHGRFFSPYKYRPVTVKAGLDVIIGDGGSMVQDAGATALVIAGAYGLVSTFDYLSQQKLIEQNLSRKLVHILSGLLFMASWPIFSASSWARYFASVVPLTNCLRLVIHGLSLATDEGLIKSVTREGKPEELLRGPLYYVLVLILSAVLFWRESPVGIISVAMMCGGDGIADIVGRRFGSTKLPHNKQKSWAGSLSMFALGSLVSVGMLYYFSVLGYFHLDWVSTVERVAVVSLIATIVESLPITGTVDDNVSVPLVSMVVASLAFGY